MAWYMYAQIPVTGPMNVGLRVHGDPLAILPAARKVVQQMDPNLPLIKPVTQRRSLKPRSQIMCCLRGSPGFSGSWRWARGAGRWCG
jgi:hypothetical protein